VQPVAGLARIGLGHEGGIHLVVVGDVLDQPLEQHRVVASLDRVGDVMQVDLKLRRGAFLDDGVGRDALFLGAFENVLQAVDVLVEVVDQVDLGRLRALAGNRRARRLRPAVHVLLVDQVELQLERGADGQAQFVEAAHHLAQHLARVGEERLAIALVHGHQQLCGGATLPGFAAERVGNREAGAVRVTDVHAQTGAFHGDAVDIQGEQRGGQVDAFLVHLVQAGAFDALATHDAVHVCNEEVDVKHLRVFLEKRVRFVELNGTRRGKHDEAP